LGANAEQTWLKLNAPDLLLLVASGVRIQDGVWDKAKSDCRAPQFQPKLSLPETHLHTD